MGIKLHPDLILATARCSSCGSTFGLRSTRETLEVDVCRNCHPAYTGRARAVATGGRVERFERRQRLARR